jgi:hypothetical protein
VPSWTETHDEQGQPVRALRAAFPADLDQVAIETADTPQPLHYTWRDLDRGTAMMANLLEPEAAAGSRAWRCRWRRASRR